MFGYCESILTRHSRRKQKINVSELISTIEASTRITFYIHVYKILLSVYPEAYEVYLQQNELAITIG